MRYTDFQNDEKDFSALTGLNLAVFETLLPIFSELVEQYLQYHTFSGKPRKRKFSQRNDCLLTNEDKIFFILSYYKNNPLQVYHAAAFNLTQDMANKWIGILLPLLEKPLTQAKEAILIDATERPIERLTYDQDFFLAEKEATQPYKCNCHYPPGFDIVGKSYGSRQNAG